MSVRPVVLTRIRPPQRRKEILRRPRLLDILHRNIHRKLTFVSAPAGYGKTALLLDFAADLDAPVCWYGVSPEHSDLPVFAQHLIAAFQQVFPKFGQRWAPVDGAGPPDPYGLAVDFSNEMVRRVNDFCVVILDDFHVVAEVQPIVNFFEALLDHLPENVRFIAASRNVYGVPIIPLFVHEELTTIGIKDLRFRPDELQALVWQSQHVSLPIEQANELAKSTDGWIIALLVAVRAPSSIAAPAWVARTDHLYVFLADEVFRPLPDRLQRFMLATSILGVFTADLSARVFSGGDTDGLLQELLDRNLFISTTDGEEGPSYQYHQLFADFLQDWLIKNEPTQALEWHSRAGDWFAERGDQERCVLHWLQAGRGYEAAASMDRSAADYYAAGRTNVLEMWLNLLEKTPELLADAPRLQLYRAKMFIDAGQSETVSRQLLGWAEESLRRQGDVDQIANTLLTLSRWHLNKNEVEAALYTAIQARDMLGNGAEFQYRRLQAARLQGIARQALGEIDAAITLLQSAADGYRLLDKRHDLVMTLNDLTAAYHERGDMLATQICALEAVDLQRQTAGGLRLVNSLNNAGFVLYETGRYREAWLLFEEAYSIARNSNSPAVLSHLLNSRGDLLRDLEEWSAAREAYETADTTAKAGNYSGSLPATYVGLMALEQSRGDFNAAMHWLREVARMQPWSPEALPYQLNLGAIYLEMGQVSLARIALEKALARAGTSAQPRLEVARTEFLLARALYAEGRGAEALNLLHRSLEKAALLGYDQFLVVEARRAPGLLAAAAKKWPANAQVRSICERVAQFAVGLASLQASLPPQEPATPAPPLEVLAFGPGLVRRSGEPISGKQWTSERSRALFLFLVDRHSVTREEIGLNFWPDFSPEKLRSNFHATLWRVRRAVGGEVLLHEEDCYSLAPDLKVWYDVGEFEEFARRGQDRSESDDDRAEAWRQAVGLYSGPFLTGIDMAWAEARRRELEASYGNGLVYLARWEQQRQHFEAARQWCQSALGLDPYSEELARLYMSNCLSSGDVARGRSFFQDFKRRLADDLQTKPSEDLQALFERLNRS